MSLQSNGDCLITSHVRWRSRCVCRGVSSIYLTG